MVLQFEYTDDDFTSAAQVLRLRNRGWPEAAIRQTFPQLDVSLTVG